MNKEILHCTTTASLNNTMSFPEIVQLLMKEGIESYHVDLVQNKKTFYMPTGETYTEEFNYQGPQTAADFSKEQVVAAIRASQAKIITYPQFLEQILKAGTTKYTVYINGRKAIYVGRNGDFHIEDFPNK